MMGNTIGLYAGLGDDAKSLHDKHKVEESDPGVDQEDWRWPGR